MNPIIKNTYLGIGVSTAFIVSFIMLLLLRHFIAAVIVMIIFISIVVFFAMKFRVNFKSNHQVIQELKHRNLHIRSADADVHIDDIKNDAEHRQKILKEGYPSTSRPSMYDKHHSIKKTKSPKKAQVTGNNCSNCGTTLTTNQKFCPSCGSRLA
jgi:hypothetical protein